MQLQLHQLLPDYFEDSRKEGSEVWGKDLVFDRGELVKIIAPSGSGKTSLMHFLYGLRRDYRGTIAYGDRRLEGLGPEGFAALRTNAVSIVLQDLRLFPTQTVFANINIKRQLNPYHSEEKITEMAQRLGIGDKLSALCGQCSYGEQQRVAIIRALMQPYDFLLLDEPFSHLDNRNAERAMELMLEETAGRDASILFADLERVGCYPFTRLYHL